MKPVRVWLPSAVEPVRAGHFEIVNRQGRFRCSPEYRAREDAVALDPVHLPLTRRLEPHTEARQDGLFGVFRNACLDGFGFDLLEAIACPDLEGPLDHLELGVGYGIVALEVCDDISQKVSWRSMTAVSLISSVQTLGPGPSALMDLFGAFPDLQTSLGGERPRLTVEYKGQLWIAKFSARGDAPNAVVRELAAMRSAQAAGIDVADVEFMQAGHHQMLLVRRFDRERDRTGNIRRRLYASAHTVLGLDKAAIRGDRRRSCVAFAQELKRWSRFEQAVDEQRELFRRMVFNVVCGNGDDHPRNRGLIFLDGGWRLSPAFDIAPPAVFSGALSLAVNRVGGSTACARDLLVDCAFYGWERSDALDYVSSCVDTLDESWSQVVGQAAGLDGQLTRLEPK